jgi:hypothetical protein
MNQDLERSSQGEGTTTRVALEGIKVCSALKCVPFGKLLAKDFASYAVLMIADSIVKVLPKPISSARIPPPVSIGSSFFSKPVIECIYLDFVSYLTRERNLADIRSWMFRFPKTVFFWNRARFALHDEL